MSPVVTIDLSDEALAKLDDALDTTRDDIAALERAWHGNSATLTVLRNGSGDFQDRQVFLYVDDELWGKVKYGRPVSREIPPGRHKVRAFNTLFSHTIEIDAIPGEHVRLKCTNGLARGGWIMMVIWQVAALKVRLERE
jgi:hypothetical protein